MAATRKLQGEKKMFPTCLHSENFVMAPASAKFCFCACFAYSIVPSIKMHAISRLLCIFHWYYQLHASTRIWQLVEVANGLARTYLLHNGSQVSHSHSHFLSHKQYSSSYNITAVCQHNLQTVTISIHIVRVEWFCFMVSLCLGFCSDTGLGHSFFGHNMTFTHLEYCRLEAVFSLAFIYSLKEAPLEK